MGSALARAFLTKGHKVTVWNRSPAKAAPLAVVGAPLVITCITNSDAFRDTMENLPPSLGSDRILIDFTTSCPSQINQSAKTATKLRFKAYIHGAVMAFPAQVGREESFLYYSGNRSAFTSVESILSALGTPVYLDDDPISAALQEVIIVSSMYSWWAGLLQSIALLRTTKQVKVGRQAVSGFFEETLAPLYAHSVEIFRTMCTEIDSGKYETRGDGARLALHLASLRNFSRTLVDQGVSYEIIKPIVALVDERISQGGEDEELSALIEALSGSGSAKAPA
ncbi:hypothetical protein BDV40DRAFT_293428 [Aspergillus tamarii]|uniref:Uncharacterized protein n=1 Tax=Aspergillus tamarii TaxID=41984 RepID=A0A5N6UD86_ASPTM|nr:hypothetical protein BDV40DRAFT_293428 [Aspergillus tamarii]